MKRSIALLLLAGMAMLGLSACNKSGSGGTAGGSGEAPRKGPILRVGMELTYPPFEMQDNAGNPDGVGARLAEELAKDLDRPLKVVPMKFEGLIQALQSGEIDCILSSMTITEDRKQSIDFSEPYAFTSIAMLVGKNSDVQTAADLKKPGKKVTAKASTTGETWARANLPDSGVVVLGEQSACVQEVADGRADAFVYDQLSIYRSSLEHPGTTRAVLNPIQEEGWGIGIAKGNPEMLKKVNEFIAKFRASGGFGRLAERYLTEEKKVLEKLGIPFILR